VVPSRRNLDHATTRQAVDAAWDKLSDRIGKVVAKLEGGFATAENFPSDPEPTRRLQ
jgi:hypothetical protein